MNKIIKRLVTILCLVLLLSKDVVICYATNQESAPKESELYAKAAVLMDADSGRILYAKNGTDALANASTTKILTCILALEYSQPDAVVEVSVRAASAPKVHLGTEAGQHFYMIDLLYALMLESYNDCAVAIAEHIAGSVEDFAKIMNQRAKDIGCLDTYFITPNGLDGTDENGFHHTTAEDLALLMRYCVMRSAKWEEFRAITATKNYSFCEIDSGRNYSVVNRNAFLDMMQGAFSGKTGFTGNAGYCYVGALTRDDRTYIVALLACGWPNNRTYKWSDSKKLMQYGIEHYKKVNLNEMEIDLEEIGTIIVENGQGERIGVDTYTGVKLGEVTGIEELLIAKEEEVKVSYQVKQQLNAPVAMDTQIGSVFITIDDTVLREYKILTIDEVAKIDFVWCMKMIVTIFVEGI
ncbi:MAG: D-alanyl-D-alanine carboxypeptidase [Roseburia sp.]|nr:D-alanyl-D-alanine carboxypeptidase [Roseburia sp.]